ncbi:MAG: phenylalanine--tRNA ligase subunit alpha [Bdellovibrionota bacterium]
MTQDLQNISKQFSDALSKSADLDTLERLRVDFLGKKGLLTLSLRTIGQLPADERPAFGEKVNALRCEFETALQDRKTTLEEKAMQASIAASSVDISLPGRRGFSAPLHPLRQIETDLVRALQSLGFSVERGPEIETDHYNFESLNFPADHPARDMQDTFFVKGDHLLRTHTSPVQVRLMESQKPPVQVVSPVECIAMTPMQPILPCFIRWKVCVLGQTFHFPHLKGTLEAFVKMIFGSKAHVRFRPSFFPFTEPSAEIDVMGPNGWMEILGCGMVDPNVFVNVGKKWEERGEAVISYAPEKISGFAFDC